jgi:UDP-N-acetylmuramoylalanine--D-glutamate ligase
MLSVAEIPLPGRHNQYNVLCALTMLRAAGFGWEALRKGLATFPGVEHRLERVGVIDGVTYVNDSKSTTPESLRAALACCAAPVTLIAGGRGKAGADYAGALSLAKERVRRMLVLGEEAAALEKAFGETVPVTRCDSLEAAVAAAKLASGPGGTVLLSPACASFDMFTDFEERGRAFKACVEELSQGGPL